MKRKDCIAMLLAGGEGKRLAPLRPSWQNPLFHSADTTV